MPPKHKRHSVADLPVAAVPTQSPKQNGPANPFPILPRPVKSAAPKRQASRRTKVDTNPDQNGDILDGKAALRASSDANEKGEALNVAAIVPPPITPAKAHGIKRNTKAKVQDDSDSPLSDLADETPVAKKQKKMPTKSSIAAKKGSDEIKAFRAEQAAKKAAEMKIKKELVADKWDNRYYSDGDEAGPVEKADVLKLEAARPPPVNSDYLPLPWKGRLGYACLNTYLRFSNPPVFSSRTCRIASILEHRHPLKDPSQPEHSTKNRPDKTKPASPERGQKYVEDLGIANAKDIVKMLRWNNKYGIRFLRLSSEMFPFASHAEYGYRLAPFASEVLAEAGRVATEFGHRLSTHPGQFTQLGSPRAEVIANAIRDLEYHDEMLSLLKMPTQEDRNAVMILHLGGTFGDKAATIDRFRENYKGLSDSIKRRIVLENDDVSWSVHDLLPICEELNIPLCLDFHHNNIIFNPAHLREGTKDIMELYPRIKATWDKKQIKQKMHYSESCPEAITGRQRRKHNPRPITLPPCPPDMDLMIEAKDKEQSVFELMRTFKLPGWDTFNNIIPYERNDGDKPWPKKVKKKTKKQIAAEIENFGKVMESEEEEVQPVISAEEVGMGGKENRVYWPPGMEEWLRPKKREIKKKGGEEEDIFKNPTPANFAQRRATQKKRSAPFSKEVKGRIWASNNMTEIQAIIDEIRAADTVKDEGSGDEGDVKAAPKKRATPVETASPKKKAAKADPGVKIEDGSEEEDDDLKMPDLSAEESKSNGVVEAAPSRQSGRVKGARKSYAEEEEV
ncbi:UV-endonuclease UvdE-domain-containing protein [Calycina marina]|uniref:UV-endonuclease UvdE-domain-containing protein n=1 Tax=Calycina marina TaxID=1763456 RepID=A0A9P7ZAU5_9HELO|nr:UV-endonuclease UvdE-domain-containing protein [Calycina marina]